jgi:hypothetical protein
MYFTKETSNVLMKRIIQKGDMIPKIREEYKRISQFQGNKCPPADCIMQRIDEALAFTQFIIDYFRHQYPDEVRFMEIGTNRGGNFVLIGNMLAIVFKNVYGVAVDIPEKPTPDKPKRGWPYQKNMSAEQCIRNLQPKFSFDFVYGDSTNKDTIHLAQKYALQNGKRLDLLYIDGGHDCPTCMCDWDYYSGMVKNGGLITVHDVAGCYSNRGVMLWNRIAPFYKHWVFANTDERGVGVVRFDHIMIR